MNQNKKLRETKELIESLRIHASNHENGYDLSRDLVVTRMREAADALERAEAMADALSWALPLAGIALEDHRIVRIKAGHQDIVAQRANGEQVVGLWQREIDEQEHARAALDAYREKGETT